MSAPTENPSVPNLLKERAPELVKEFKAFQSRLGDLLLSKLDEIDAALRNAGPRGQQFLLPLEDLRATTHILRVLTKDSWTEQDIELFDAFWRNAARSDLFADEFESCRHRIQSSLEDGRRLLLESPNFQQGTFW